MNRTIKNYTQLFFLLNVIIALLLGCDASSKKTSSISKDNTPFPSGQKIASAISTNNLITGIRHLNVNGTNRTFTLYVPKSYNPATKTPLVIDYHGIFGNGAGHMESSGYKQVADTEGFLVAYPDGIDSAWNIGPCCTFSREVDDVAFARAIVKKIHSEANLDEARIYAAGFSNGGGMTQYLACHAADLFAAVAPSAFDLLEENSPSCSPARPIPILLTRALDDNFVTYAGGPSNPPNGLATTIHFMGAVATFNRWTQINHCSSQITKDEFGCEIHTACDAQVEVGLCSVPHKGHTPGDANIGWKFLKRFKKQ